MRRLKPILTIFIIAFILGMLILPTVFGRNSGTAQVVYVEDYADVISSTTEDYINACNEKLYSRTGAQILVMTQNKSSTSVIRDGNTNFEAWKLSLKDRWMATMLLFSISKQQSYIAMGDTAYDTLPYVETTNLVASSMSTHFLQGDYDAGIRKAFDAVYQMAESAYPDAATPPTHTQKSSPANYVVLSLLLALLSGLLVLLLPRDANGNPNISYLFAMSGMMTGGRSGSRGGNANSGNDSGGGGSTRGGGAGRS